MEIQERKEWVPWESSGGRSQIPWHRLEHFYLQKLQLLGNSPGAIALPSLETP